MESEILYFVLCVLVGLAIGVLVGYLIGRRGFGSLSAMWDMTKKESERLQKALEDKTAEAQDLGKENVVLKANQETMASQIEELYRQKNDVEAQSAQRLNEQREQMEAEKDRLLGQMREQIDSERKNAQELIEATNARLDAERQHFNELMENNQKQWDERMETMRAEVARQSAERLAAREEALQQTNRTQMDELLRPIKEQFANFKKSVDESKTQNEVSKKEIQERFDATMRVLYERQEYMVRRLGEQTERIGNDAANLTRALKGDSKVQGDWGEMVLETILESSGLRRDEEFFVQKSVVDSAGGRLRPDVVVRFPEGRSVVIDSKVSLKAYSEAVAAVDEESRQQLLRRHVMSVRQHVDELSAKDYGSVVSDAIGFVLMFIPNESSYVAAMKMQPDLSRYAYAKRIIIISPSNLLMTLQLAYNLWQYDRQTKNVDNIVRAAAELYDKVAGFSESFEALGVWVKKIDAVYAEAKARLYEGQGNVMRRLEKLKEMGVSPKKQIKGLG